jgi:RNA polymerase sigma-70 factor (ECF subfamily)
MTPADNPSSMGSTSSGLLARVQAKDQDAWRKLVRLYGPLVDYWIRQSQLQAADAEDVFQEVFRAVAANVGTFRHDRASGTFRGWLRTITRRKLTDYFRRLEKGVQTTGGADAQHALADLPFPGNDDPGESQEVETIQRRVLELVRAEFEERTWQAFWRTTVEGQNTRDAGTELGMSPEAVRMARSRVLRRLREEMEGLDT